MKRTAVTTVVVMLMLRAMIAGAEATELGPAYVTISNFAGFRIPGVGEQSTGNGWAAFSVPDFSNNNSYYVKSNTDAIQANLQTDAGTRQKTLRFDIGGPVAVGSYTELASTDPTTNGHRFTSARFDWAISLPAEYERSGLVRLELCPGWAYADTPCYWSVQPGPGLQSGHVEVDCPDTWDICLRVAAVEEIVIPEPSSVSILMCGLAFLGILRNRKPPDLET